MSGSVVLVHGLRTSSTMWRVQRLALEEQGYEVITPDLPGHGTRMPERFTLDGAVETIAAAVASGRPPVTLVGFSLGGYLSIHYAGLARQPIAALVAASCGTEPYRAILEAWRAVAAIIHRFPDRGLALNNAALAMVVHDKELANDVLAGGVALEVMDDVLRELRRLDIPASLARIEQPVWFVNGQYDHFRLQERRYPRATADGRLVHIPRASHLVSLSQPALFTRVLLDALESVGTRT
jgi:pimeloyl-ACP methyl ester carboxylesterase